jgi:hypothetical protein
MPNALAFVAAVIVVGRMGHRRVPSIVTKKTRPAAPPISQPESPQTQPSLSSSAAAALTASASVELNSTIRQSGQNHSSPARLRMTCAQISQTLWKQLAHETRVARPHTHLPERAASVNAPQGWTSNLCRAVTRCPRFPLHSKVRLTRTGSSRTPIGTADCTTERASTKT